MSPECRSHIGRKRIRKEVNRLTPDEKSKLNNALKKAMKPHPTNGFSIWIEHRFYILSSHIISEVGLIKNLKPIIPKKACKIQILNKLVFGDIANYHGAPFTICNHPTYPDVGVSCCPHSDKLSEFLVWHRFYTGI